MYSKISAVAATLLALTVMATVAVTPVVAGSPRADQVAAQRLPQTLRKINTFIKYRMQMHTVKTTQIARHRRFREQQAADGTIEDIGRTCTDMTAFNTALDDYLDNCQAIGWDLETLYNNSATTQQVADTCGSTCYNKYLGLIGTYAACWDSTISIREAALSYNSAVLLCSQTNGQYCATLLHRLDELDCSTDQESECSGANKECTWNSEFGFCQSNPSATALSGICTQCLFSFLGFAAQFDKSFLLFQLEIQQYTCKKVGTEFCLPHMFKYFDEPAIFGFGSNSSRMNQVLDKVCTDATDAPCFRSSFAISKQLDLEIAKEVFRDCIKTYATAGATVLKSMCFSILNETFTFTQENQELYQAMCSVNPTSDEYCLSLFPVIFKEDSCIDDAFFGQCNSTCDAHLHRLANRIGCCGKVLNGLLRERDGYYDPDLLPGNLDLAAFGVTAPVKRPPVPWGETHLMYFLTACPSLNNSQFRMNVTGECPIAFSPQEVEVELAFSVPYNKFSGDARLGKKFLSSVTTDSSSSWSVNMNQMGEWVLVEDTNASVSTAGHHMFAMAQNQAGVKVTTKIKATNTAELARVQAEASSQLSSGSMALGTTSATLTRECSGCIPISGKILDTGRSSGKTVTATGGTTMAPGVAGGTTATPGTGGSTPGTPIPPGPGVSGGTTAVPGGPDVTDSASMVSALVAVVVAAALAVLA